MTTCEPATAPHSESCDLCIIGTGIAGLNALFVAAEYLRPDDRVIMIDKRDEVGGMWVDVYDYARLHQPHPTFTVGDIEWALNKPQDYLASAPEVAAHLRYCYDRLKGKVQIFEFFGHTVTTVRETQAEGGTEANVVCHPNGHEAHPVTITAKRLIRATGFDVQAAEPLTFSSRKVVSTTPERFSSDCGFDTDTPVYVIGGGKTGVETAYALITRRPGHPVTLINGRGTVFVDRAKIFPAPQRAWFRGQTAATFFRKQAMAFDGTNENEAFGYLKDTMTVSVGKDDQGFLFGLMSRAECDVVADGVDDVIGDYLTDVLDSPKGPVMFFRSGARKPVPEGSVFVNCTGHLMRRSHAYAPYISKGGAIMSITTRSMINFLSSVTAYLLTHLFFRGQLRDLPLYELDGEMAFRRSQRLYTTAMTSVSFLNQLIIMKALPAKIFARCGLDTDRGYPLPRRLLVLAVIMLNRRHYLSHCRESLDRLRLTQCLRCGPLSETERRKLPPVPMGTVDRRRIEAGR